MLFVEAKIIFPPDLKTGDLALPKRMRGVWGGGGLAIGGGLGAPSERPGCAGKAGAQGLFSHVRN